MDFLLRYINELVARVAEDDACGPRRPPLLAGRGLEQTKANGDAVVETQEDAILPIRVGEPRPLRHYEVK